MIRYLYHEIRLLFIHFRIARLAARQENLGKDIDKLKAMIGRYLDEIC